MSFDNVEMQKLENLLKEEGIPYANQSDNFGIFSTMPKYAEIERIHIYLKKSMTRLASVVHGYGTYGGYSKADKSDDGGLLEVMTWRDDDPIGYVKADEAFRMIEEAIETKAELIAKIS